MQSIVPLSRFFQLGYVTREIDEGVEHFSKRFGIRNFKHMRNMTGHSRHIALAYIGDLMIEIIEPNDPVNGLYSSAVPSEPGPCRLHHHGFLIEGAEEWAALSSGLIAQGIEIVSSADIGAMHFLYADARAELGHFVEYIWLAQAGREMFASVPQNAPRSVLA